ncbi:MAG: DUF748 domain-containing protein [Desulfomonile tiedjei]|nr:DUF748 domain-containing protein [Desulfomonile tiedjei]
MSRVSRLFSACAVLVGLVAVLAILAFFAVWFLSDTDLVKSAVTDKLRELTGQEIVVGSIKFTWGVPDLVGLKLEAIRATGTNGEQLASIDRLTLTPSLPALLHREILISSITIDGLRASVNRTADGTIAPLFVLAPVASKPTDVARAEQPAQPVPAQPRDDSRGLQWSIKTLKLAGGRIDLIDRHAVPGKEVIVSLLDLRGSLAQQGSGNAFSVDIHGRLGDAKTTGNSLALTGLVTLTPDLSQPDRVDLAVTSDALTLEPFHPYVPKPVAAAQIGLEATRCRVTWEKNHPAPFSVETQLKAKSWDAGFVKFNGQGTAASDFSQVLEAHGSAHMELVPLAVFKSLVTDSIPFKLADGKLKARVDGTWKPSSGWKLHGTVDLENLSPARFLERTIGRVRVSSPFELSDEALVLQKLEISNASPLASVAGRIAQPFSGKPTVDLSGVVMAQGKWIRDLGVALPQEVKLTGPIPVQTRVHGPLGDMAIDLKGDLTATELHYPPYVEKASGDKAACSVKARLLGDPGHDGSPGVSGIRCGFVMAKPRIRLHAAGPWISPGSVTFDSGILLRGKSVDLKDATLTVKKGAGSAEILSLKGDIGGLGSRNPTVKTNLTALVDADLLTMIGTAASAGLTLTGAAHLKAACNGTVSELQWTMDLPLSRLGIQVAEVFKKPTGVDGSFKAGGKWAKDELQVQTARLTMPGLTVLGSGTAVDRKGRAGNLNLELKRSDLKDVARLSPALANVKVQGPVEATISLRSGENQALIPDGVFRLADVEYRPPKGAWFLKKLRGTVKTDGSSLSTEQLTGWIDGPITAPVNVNASLNNVQSNKSVEGKVSLEMGSGRIQADRLRQILQSVQVLTGSLLNPQGQDKKTDSVQLDSLKGDFEIHAGTAQTSNLRLKAQELTAGAVGSVRLSDGNLDAFVGLHTVVVGADALGKIPAVQGAMKKYSGILKATGIDKELKRFGIQVPAEGDQEKQEPAGPVKTPVTVMLKVRGPAAGPAVTPILENGMDKATAARLKSLIQ